METYEQTARRARRRVLKMIHEAGTSHIGSNFSVIDIATALYRIVNLGPDLAPDRDRVVWSKGWAAATAYFFLAEKGVLTDDDLDTFCKGDSKLLGLVEPAVRGIEVAGGAMGHGLPIGLGMALAAKRGGESWKTYVIMSDGEMDCGTTWESALIGAHHELDNLTVIVDCNQFQAMGKVKDVLNVEPLIAKWRAFGWDVHRIDGHDFTELDVTLSLSSMGKPKIIITDTTKGKGVSFMENKLEWHYKNVSAGDYEKALQELPAL